MTGATGGVGRAVVSALAAAGHRITAVGGDPARLGSLGGVQAIPADLARPQRLAEAIKPPARLDALVHSTGVSLSAIAPVGGTGAAVWQETMAVNVLAAAEVTRLLLPSLRRSRGHVVMINSAPAVRTAPGWSAFAATSIKTALRELADSLRREEACYGIRVTTIYPGGSVAEQSREVRAAFGSEYDPHRPIRPETLAATVAWVLGAPPDAYVSELSVLAGPHGGAIRLLGGVARVRSDDLVSPFRTAQAALTAIRPAGPATTLPTSAASSPRRESSFSSGSATEASADSSSPPEV